MTLASDLFKENTEKGNALSDDPDGFIDYKGQIHRIKTAEEFKNLYEIIFGETIHFINKE